MVNSEEFIARLEKILEYYALTASAFADKIGVQRSSLSHLLSGRNKPSLDFILKILDVFPEVDLYWILNGKGNFPKDNFNPPNAPPSELKKITTEENSTVTPKSSSSTIEKIVVFYTNGTFSEYLPK